VHLYKRDWNWNSLRHLKYKGILGLILHKVSHRPVDISDSSLGLKKEKFIMGYSKKIQVGPASLSISESAGAATVAISVDESLGGGSIAGVAKAKASAEIDVEAQVLIDAGFALAEAKWPTIAPYLKMAQVEIDSLVSQA
jgi:hypothetical protein